MTTTEQRTAQFYGRFSGARAAFLPLYLALRENGDTHAAAVDAVMAEIQMEAVTA